MAISSLFLRSSAASLACLLLLTSPATAATYQLEDDFSGASFFDNFDFFTAPDLTNGFVNYISEEAAQNAGLISASNGQPARFGVDSTTVLNANSGPGRNSVRFSSKNSYTHGLIISDIVHMPFGCGTWPAHWTLGPDWPTNGEIDIIEGVNNAATNLMSLHSSPGCTIAGSNQTGTLQSNNCDTTINYNQGCGVTADTTASYGSGFNGGLGGVYATEWTSQYIRIWLFPRGSIPADITAGTPDPTQWGLPQANLQGSCDIDSKFANHKIIFDTTFCGDYGNADWNNNAQCMALSPGSTCSQYVAANPSAFADAYWSVNSVKVYKQVGATSSTPVITSQLTSATPVSSVLAPGMGNSTMASGTSYVAATTATANPSATNPSTIGTFAYIGCVGSTSAFSSFIQVDNNAAMSLERCVGECSSGSYTYAGVFNTLCFCANSIDSGTSISAAQGQCSNPCPGNLNEFCGGTLLSSRLSIRQASNNILLSVYENRASGPLVSVVPAGLTLGYGMGGGAAASQISTVIISTSYINVCDVCEGGYTTVPYTSTVVRCGCVANEFDYGAMTSPAVPMAAVETVCAACGPNGAQASVVVTVPSAVAAVATSLPLNVQGFLVNGTVVATVGATGTSSGFAQFTGGAVGKVTGSFCALVVGAGAALALL